MLLALPVGGADGQPAIGLPLSEKLTLPVGVLPVTIAVNTTFVPTGAGFSELVSIVAVDATAAAAGTE